ncbi:Vacuolar protein sorting-associated protein 9b [Madurella mycetomatis]|uniref:Vacuolar protein sorting-associated protein 9b n=2 Tax=Madurella mycetomatis TaxID=100816 RepID=A0A175WBT8_9PEZI|nr:Vacuolar protein sorting-associated protein 9b [Madurella mycetomatis]
MLASLSLSGSPMASNPTNPAHRQSPLRPVRSFRVERSVSPDKTTRVKRASTIENGPAATARLPQRTASGTQVKRTSEAEAPDMFESRISEEAAEPPRASVDLDDLPIEVISLADRFVDSLSAKVHPHPPNIDNLARLFQDFYATASSHIQTHVDSLATLQKREEPSPPSLSSRPSAASLLRTKATSLGTKEKPKVTPARHDSDQQLLTAEEYADRRKARKALEQKKGLLEEAVERRLCEGIYSKIYRHRSTQDEAQDAKLRSKTAALAVVGIGPADLGVELGTADSDLEAATKKQAEVKEWLDEARKELILMSQSRYPLGKLNHLKAAHKSIIDTLSHFHPSSSADELMPMLIYTLITLPPENLNVISDVNFIQRFRWEPKLVGEAAYCLTTLEATISFLQTVDLSTLRADETPTGPIKAPDASPIQKGETFPPAFSPTSTSPATASANSPESAAAASPGAALKQSPSSTGFRATVGAQLRGPRRLSELVNTPAQALNAASDAVLNTADHSLKTIGTSLGDSYKFLLGKLRERAPDALLVTKDGSGDPVALVVPKTLDDARKLIGTSPPPAGDAQLKSLEEEEDVASASGASSLLSIRSPSPAAAEETERPPLLSFIAGSARKVSRDHSADSARSAGSRKGGPGGEERQKVDTSTSAVGGTGTTAIATGSSPVVTSPPIMDSMRSLGNSLNPMARLSAGIGGFRGFGRSSAPAPSTPIRASTPPVKDGAGTNKGGAVEGGDLATTRHTYDVLHVLRTYVRTYT